MSLRRHWFLLKLAILNTFKRRLRAGLALGSIAFSASVMVVFFGIGDGLKSLVLTQVSNSDLRDVVTIQPRNAQQVPLDQTRLSAIKSISGVGVLEQTAGMVGKLQYHGISLDVPLYGVSEGYFDLVTVSLKSGDTRGALTQGVQNVVITTAALKAFGIQSSDAVGKKIKIAAQIPSALASRQTETVETVDLREYAIAAVLDKDTAAAVYIPLSYVAEKGVDRATQVKIRVSSADKVPTVRESVNRLGFQTTSIIDTIDQVNKVFAIIQRILLFFGAAALVVTVFGTFNTITITLIEETPQIGFLRIMGMHRRDVRFLFVAQSILLTVTGSLVGAIVGVATGGFLNGLIKSLVDDSALGNNIYVFQIPYGQTIIILMLSIALGWLVGIMPAKRAVTINPLDALHS